MRSIVVGCNSVRLCCLLLVTISVPAWAPGEVTGMKMDPLGKALIISLKGEAGKHVTRVIGRPNRLLIDFYGAQISRIPHRIRPSQGNIHEIRGGSYEDRTGIVVDYQDKPVPVFNVRRSKDRVQVVFGKSLAVPSEVGTLNKRASRTSSPGPKSEPVASTIGSGSSRVKAPACRPATPPTTDPRLPVQKITQLKFIQVGQNSRLVIRGGDRLDYRSSKISPTKLRIDLINAEIPKRHQEPLRTDLFSTSIKMIVPGSQAIFVQLKEAVPHQIQKKKGVLMIDFPPPRFATAADQKAMTAGDQQPGEGVERRVREAQARKEAVRILKKEELRLQSENLEWPIRNLLTEQDAIGGEMRAMEKKYCLTPDPEVFSKPIYTDFQNLSLKNAFRLLAEQSGINIIVGREVKGAVTMSLSRVPLGQVIDQILETNDLDRYLVGNVMWIDSKAAIQESKQQKAKEYRAALQSVERKLKRNKAQIKRVEREREEVLRELKMIEERAQEEAPEEMPSVETVKTEQIEIEGRSVTFSLVRIRLRHATPSKVKPILECVFNQKCQGTATPGAKAAAERIAERRAAREPEKEGLDPDRGDTKAHLEVVRAEQRAELRTRADAPAPGIGETPGEVTQRPAAGLDIQLEKILAHAIIWASDEYRMLFIRDVPERIEEMKTLIARLDISRPHVLISSTLVQAEPAWARGLGIIWGGRDSHLGCVKNGSKNPIRGFTGGEMAATASLERDLEGRSPVSAGDTGSTPLVNFTTAEPGLGTMMRSGIQFGLVGQDYANGLDIRLQQGQATPSARIIGRPKVQVLEGETAEIKNGRPIQYWHGRQVAMVRIDLRLQVIPTVHSDGRIEMYIAVWDIGIGDAECELEPALNRAADTTVIVGEGETVVIGGILRKTKNVTRQGQPGLMNGPVSNSTSRQKNQAEKVTELVVFITPTIIKRWPDTNALSNE